MVSNFHLFPTMFSPFSSLIHATWSIRLMKRIGVPVAKKSEYFWNLGPRHLGSDILCIHQSVHKLGNFVSSALLHVPHVTPMSRVMIFEQRYLNCVNTIAHDIHKSIFLPDFYFVPPHHQSFARSMHPYLAHQQSSCIDRHAFGSPVCSPGRNRRLRVFHRLRPPPTLAVLRCPCQGLHDSGSHTISPYVILWLFGRFRKITYYKHIIICLYILYNIYNILYISII